MSVPCSPQLHVCLTYWTEKLCLSYYFMTYKAAVEIVYCAEMHSI